MGWFLDAVSTVNRVYRSAKRAASKAVGSIYQGAKKVGRKAVTAAKSVGKKAAKYVKKAAKFVKKTYKQIKKRVEEYAKNPKLILSDIKEGTTILIKIKGKYYLKRGKDFIEASKDLFQSKDWKEAVERGAKVAFIARGTMKDLYSETNPVGQMRVTAKQVHAEYN